MSTVFEILISFPNLGVGDDPRDHIYFNQTFVIKHPQMNLSQISLIIYKILTVIMYSTKCFLFFVLMELTMLELFLIDRNSESDLMKKRFCIKR